MDCLLRARANAAHHYDLSDALYDLFLDSDRQYSCAYFPEGGESLELGGLFVGSTTRQAAPFAEQLGLECNDSTCVRVDEHARTSLPGVYAAGDMAHLASLPAPVQSVAQAIASGAIAGGSAVADREEEPTEPA